MQNFEQMRTKFCRGNFLGTGLRKTSADLIFLNLDVANGKGGVWGRNFPFAPLFVLGKWGRA